MATAAELNKRRTRGERLRKNALVMHVRLTFMNELLGTASGNEDIHGTYVAGKIKKKQKASQKYIREGLTDEQRDELVHQELEDIKNLNADEEITKGKTFFPRNDNGDPILFDYQIRGFFKSACGACRQIPESETTAKKFTAYKGKIDTLIQVYSDVRKSKDAITNGTVEDKTIREIVIHTNKPIGDCQRPLRASTPQGDRVAISDSESIAPGAWAEFDIVSLLGEGSRGMIEEWLDYGYDNGIGGWRNSRKGSFIWDYVDPEE